MLLFFLNFLIAVLSGVVLINLFSSYFKEPKTFHGQAQVGALLLYVVLFADLRKSLYFFLQRQFFAGSFQFSNFFLSPLFLFFLFSLFLLFLLFGIIPQLISLLLFLKLFSGIFLTLKIFVYFFF